MNQKQKTKLLLMLQMLEGKYAENKDYFISLAFDVFSGAKAYHGKIGIEGDTFTLSFMGEIVCESFSQAMEKLCGLVLQYDRAVVSYIERGLTTEIQADDKNVKLFRTETKQEPEFVTSLKDKKYHISLHKAKELLHALGFTTGDGKLKNDMIRKYNQTDRFIELIEDLFSSQENITVVDCACGKSYLSFVLNYWLWQEKRIKAHFVGYDISEKVISESKKTAEKLGYQNMEFIQADLSRIGDADVPHTVISLHACDTATDMALGYAIRNGATNIICVPCCHKELLEQIQNDALRPLFKHGLLKARFNDLLTDGLRMLKLESCGYEVSCVEYCSPLDTPKNLLIKAKKTMKTNARAEKEYQKMLREFHVLPAIEKYSKRQP